MGYAILDNYSIRKDGNICHIYKAEIISDVENAITVKIGELSLCQEVYVEENQREHTFCDNPTTLIINDIGVEKNYKWYLLYIGDENNRHYYIGYAEEKDTIMLSAFIGEMVCPDCLSYFYKNILKKGEKK